MLSRVIEFLKYDIWRIRLRDLSLLKSFLIRQLRIIVLAVRGFEQDKCKFRASALTFYTLLSIVPVLAMMFGIAKGFGLHSRVEQTLMNRIQEMQIKEQVITKIIDFANSLLQQTSGGFIAGIGVAFLIWSVIKVLSNIENSFNDIWGVKKPRSIGRKFSDYLSVVLICPILLVMSSSITVFIASQLQSATEKFTILQSVGPLVAVLMRLLPYCTVWIAFTFIFIFMPNTKVNFKSALIAGIVAGTIFQFVQWAYIHFQIGVSRYGAIYGSFAALPLFLIWLQISWLAVLFGGEVSFAHQNVDTYEFEPDCLSVSYSFKRRLSLLVMHLLVKDFCESKPPRDAESISHTLEIPIRLIRQILYELVKAGILSEIKSDSEKTNAYQPGRDVEKMTLQYVINALESHGDSSIPVVKSDKLDKISGCMGEFAKTIAESPANMLLKDM
ncbi:MAG: YhjD/YihY/BrkB family envelope integrity protein [Phycisphaerales bacterium]|jgi:membrane protein